jgi:hypothetical protein
MATRKYFPRWLPPTPEQGAALRRIRRRQRAVTAWWIALIPASWIVIIATRFGRAVRPLDDFLDCIWGRIHPPDSRDAMSAMRRGFLPENRIAVHLRAFQSAMRELRLVFDAGRNQ